MKRIPLILLCLILLASACKKKEVNPVATFYATQYFFPLATGNYWVYQRVAPGSPQYIQTDSVRVVSDTTINGITYYQVTGGYFEGIDDSYYRDSAGYVIEYSNPGTAQMSSWIYKLTNHRNDTLLAANENIVELIKQTGNPDTTINVIAGSFSSLQVISSTYYIAPFAPPAGVSNPRLSYLYFSKDIGVIFATDFFPSSPDIITCQLISYHTAP
jgi:hypothetical protein